MSLNKLLDQWKANEEKLNRTDQKAKAEGKLVGRFIQEQIADGYAFYRVIKENKASVRIKHVSGLGDDWQVPYWGTEATIKKDFAIQNIGYRDRLAELFSK